METVCLSFWTHMPSTHLWVLSHQLRMQTVHNTSGKLVHHNTAIYTVEQKICYTVEADPVREGKTLLANSVSRATQGYYPD